MSSLATEVQLAKAQQVTVSDDSLTVDLSDGRTISVPLGWFPRLLYGKPEERNNWRLIGKGKGFIGLILTKIFGWKT